LSANEPQRTQAQLVRQYQLIESINTIVRR
jgi:hypothetical protein